jgi:hypothetical protein
MASTLYGAYLLALLLLPLVVRWRWGLAASLLVSVAELGLVAVISPLMISPNPYSVGYPIGSSPLEQIMRRQAHGYLEVFMWVMIPAVAALIGGGLSAAWSLIQAVWRSVADQR